MMFNFAVCAMVPKLARSLRNLRSLSEICAVSPKAARWLRNSREGPEKKRGIAKISRSFRNPRSHSETRAVSPKPAQSLRKLHDGSETRTKAPKKNIWSRKLAQPFRKETCAVVPKVAKRKNSGDSFLWKITIDIVSL